MIDNNTNTFMLPISLLKRIFQLSKDELHLFSKSFLVQIVFKMLNRFCTFINKYFQSHPFRLQLSMYQSFLDFAFYDFNYKQNSLSVSDVTQF